MGFLIFRLFRHGPNVRRDLSVRHNLNGHCHADVRHRGFRVHYDANARPRGADAAALEEAIDPEAEPAILKCAARFGSGVQCAGFCGFGPVSRK